MAEPSPRGALIGPGLYAEIRRTIDRVGGMPYDAAGITKIPTDLGGGDGGYVAPTFRLATFTGSWDIGMPKAVTLVTDTASTVSATNVFIGMNPPGTCLVSIARDGTAWNCISANLAHQSGYLDTGTQVLTIVNGNLRWIGTTACA